jgi:hypothetical protein
MAAANRRSTLPCVAAARARWVQPGAGWLVKWNHPAWQDLAPGHRLAPRRTENSSENKIAFEPVCKELGAGDDRSS